MLPLPPEFVTFVRSEPFVRYARIETVAPGFVRVRNVWSNDKPEAIPASCDLPLRRAVPISGKVVDNTGKPIANAKVVARIGLKSEAESNYTFYSESWGGPSGTSPIDIPVLTDSQGRWQSGNIPAPQSDESLFLNVSHDDYFPVPRPFRGSWLGKEHDNYVAFRTGRAMTTLDRSHGARFWIHDRSGKPISNADFRCIENNTYPDFRRDGNSYLVSHLAKCKTRFLIHAPGYRPHVADFATDYPRPEYAVTLETGPKIRCQVVDQFGKPIPGSPPNRFFTVYGPRFEEINAAARVEIKPFPEYEQVSIVIKPDEHGRFEFTCPSDKEVLVIGLTEKHILKPRNEPYLLTSPRLRSD